MNPNDMKGMSFETLIELIDETVASIEGGDVEAVRDFFERLAAKKTADRRTWGRMSMLAQDALVTFDPSNKKRLCDILRALKAIAQVALKR